MEEQILRYYLKIFSVILIFQFFYIFYIFFIKDISLIDKQIKIEKNENIESVIRNNFQNEYDLNKFIFINFLKIYNLINFDMHYGDFLINDTIKFYKFINIVTKPSNVVNKITIVEGWSKFELDQLMNEHFQNFKSLQYDEIIAETYFLNSSQSFDNFKDKLINFKNNYFYKKNNNILLRDFTVKEIIIIGSLIEKEGIDYDDKKKIFSVIINRLKKNMKLQIDATVIYALTNGKYDLNRKLTYNDLKIKHPYNTYFIKGLPPEPISYVGLKTIELIFENYKTNYLFYFYNKYEDKHIFSESYFEHKKKLNEYRTKK